MKRTFLFLSLSVFILFANGQNSKRRITFRTIDKDSIGLPLNEGYFLIEDTCAKIIRYCRYDFNKRKFYGNFKDISKTDPNLVVSEGTYSPDGLKEGIFTSHYLNGNLLAKGTFLDNKFDGKWDFYYEDGKPKLSFEVTGGVYFIKDAWQPDGKKTVTDGNGIYIADQGTRYWKGKLVGGKPDGKWNLIGTDDVSEASLASESFKKGQFREGAIGDYTYKDMSHIELVNPFLLPFVNAEKMLIWAVPCGGKTPKHLVNAQYKDGMRFFSNHIGEVVTPYLSSINLKDYAMTVVIEGEVAENGAIINLKNNNSSAEGLVRGIILRLKTLPPLQPATADGVPVKQKFTISFYIANGAYQFNYRFLPLEVN